MNTPLYGQQTTDATSVRSTFVTVLAWIFIVGSAFGTVISIFQAAMFSVALPGGGLWSDPGKVRGLEQMPSIVQFMLANVRLFFIVGWSIIIVTLVAAIGLLRRKNWARLYFVILMALGIVWNIAGLLLQLTTLSSFPMPESAPPDFVRQFEVMRMVMVVANSLFVVALTVLFAWVIRRLSSGQVRAEFDAL